MSSETSSGQDAATHQVSGRGAADAGVLTCLDADSARRWAVITRASLAARRAEIDALNVFPVPDGDTGTNLYLTFDAALDAARVDYERDHPDGQDAPFGEISANLARAMLLSARGNSGVILSQIFRGMADEVAARGADALDAAGLAGALARADELAWSAVAHPVEGTILSVSRAAAEAASRELPRNPALYAVTSAALDAARAALARTPAQLAALERAGVVDAGGAGYVLLLEALERVVSGDAGEELSIAADPLKRRTGWARPAVAGHPDREGDLEPGGPAYEVMFLLSDSGDEAVARMRETLDGLGDSLIVVGSGDLWNVHVHVDDVGAALEAGVAAGRPHRIKVTHFREQGAARAEPSAVAVVACAAGEGLADVFRAAGARVVLSVPGRRASAGQLLDAVRATGAASVLVLPNDPDTELAAQAAARAAAEDQVAALVVRSRSAVQGIAALAVFDPDGTPGENALAMSNAAAATRHGAVTVATREALTTAGWCRAGDVLGVVDADIVVIGSDEHEVGGEVAARLLASGGELLTLVSGADAPADLAESVAAAVRIRWRDVEVSTIHGGQAAYSLLLGVE